MIKTTLKHLTDDGIMVVQFGELDFDDAPNRTSRYIITARKALEELGIKDPNNHMLVVARASPTSRRPLDDHGQAHAVHAGRGRPVRRRRCAKLPDAASVAAPGHDARRPAS